MQNTEKQYKQWPVTNLQKAMHANDTVCQVISEINKKEFNRRRVLI